MNRIEGKITLILSLLFSLRMLGLFLLLPVFSALGMQLAGATPQKIGFAIGIYSLLQMLLQPLLGYWADRKGRKKVILIGLTLFLCGSLLAAVSHHIYGVIAGRMLQGTGAISAAILALATDLTSDEARGKVMACIGMSIGLSFGVGFTLGPWLAAQGGLSAVFAACAVLAALGILLLWFFIPEPAQLHLHAKVPLRQVLQLDLVYLYFSAFMLHGILSAYFYLIPLWLQQHSALAFGQHWRLYLPGFLLSLLVMLPLIAWSERYRQPQWLNGGAITVLAFGIGLWLLPTVSSLLPIACFFIGFNLLEASQPAQMSRRCPADLRGTAMGCFSSCQFAGAALGVMIGSWIYSDIAETGLLYCLLGACLLWLLIAVVYWRFR